MTIQLRMFRSSDRRDLVRLMARFQEDLLAMDNIGILRTHPKFASSYLNRMLRRVKRHDGMIFVAVDRRSVIGFVAGIMARQTKADLLEYIPIRKARIIELYVDRPYRGQGIGTLLLKKIESFFKKSGCRHLELGVYAFNGAAHDFYRKMGYKDLEIDMLKEI